MPVSTAGVLNFCKVIESLFKSDFGFSVFNFKHLDLKKPYSYGIHAHDHIEIGYVRSGSLNVKIGELNEKLTDGQALVIYPGAWHSMTVDDEPGCSLMLLEFGINNLSVLEFKEDPDDNLLFLYSLLNKAAPYLIIPGSTDIKDVMERLFDQIKKLGRKQSSLTKLYFLELFIHLGRRLKERKDLFLDKTDRHVVKALQYIHNNFLENPGVEAVALHCGISDRYLRKIFLKQTGMQLVDYKHHLRMKLATELLKDNSLRLTEIAYRCGYSTQQYFCKVFKDHFGSSPGEYRTELVG